MSLLTRARTPHADVIPSLVTAADASARRRYADSSKGSHIGMHVGSGSSSKRGLEPALAGA
jgi:hypothetical protein